MSEFKLPTEIIELPSKGLLYPKDSELSKGTIEIKYMTAKEEDILTNQSYIKKGVVLDKLMQSVIVTKVNYGELLTGDKNAIMVACRVLGYGKDYTFSYDGEEYTIDLSLLENKPIKNPKLFEKGENEFEFTLPYSKNLVTFKLLTHSSENKIQKELDGLKKIHKDNLPELSTRLKHIITSVEGKRDPKDIREFVDKYLLARDSKSLRKYIKEIQPDVDLTFFPDEDEETKRNIPMGVDFFWPEL